MLPLSAGILVRIHHSQNRLMAHHEQYIQPPMSTDMHAIGVNKRLPESHLESSSSSSSVYLSSSSSSFLLLSSSPLVSSSYATSSRVLKCTLAEAVPCQAAQRLEPQLHAKTISRGPYRRLRSEYSRPMSSGRLLYLAIFYEM